MADHTFKSELVEEFYNSCHTKDSGRFCAVGSKGKKFLKVPMSEAASRSNAILRRLSSDRKTKEYKTARARLKDTWANREKGQGGLRGVKGTGSKAADTARAANAIKGAQTRKGQPNKDGSEALKGAYKTTGNKTKDALNITRLDRGSDARKAAAKAFEKKYGNPSKPAAKRTAKLGKDGSTAAERRRSNAMYNDLMKRRTARIAEDTRRFGR